MAKSMGGGSRATSMPTAKSGRTGGNMGGGFGSASRLKQNLPARPTALRVHQTQTGGTASNPSNPPR